MLTLFNLFGEPQALAHQHSIGAKDYKLACNWLRTVEALFRRLLFIEASYYVGEVTPPKPRVKRPRPRREMAFFPDQPDAWRVTFRTMERGRPRHRRASRSHRAPLKFYSAWPLAERFEALLRVHNNPVPYAKRLARRLNAESASDILKAPPELQHRIDLEPYAEIDTALRRAALSVFARRAAGLFVIAKHLRHSGASHSDEPGTQGQPTLRWPLGSGSRFACPE
jgi:hypothetical protein